MAQRPFSPDALKVLVIQQRANPFDEVPAKTSNVPRNPLDIANPES